MKYGRWIPHGTKPRQWVECSECNTVGSPLWKCCPICEAKMLPNIPEQTIKALLDMGNAVHKEESQ